MAANRRSRRHLTEGSRTIFGIWEGKELGVGDLQQGPGADCMVQLQS